MTDLICGFLALLGIVGLLGLGYWSLQAKSLAWCLVRLAGSAVGGMVLVAFIAFIILSVANEVTVPGDF